MIILIVFSCVTHMVSAVPVRPIVLPPLLLQGKPTQAQRVAELSNQLLDAQTLSPLSPNTEQPEQAGVIQQAGVTQQQGVIQQQGVTWQSGPQVFTQFMLPAQHYTWPPLGGSPMIIPLQPNVYGSQPANQPTHRQQPLVYPPYSYFPLLSSAYRNQMFSPYGYPMIVEPTLPQNPANSPPNSPVLPAETLTGPAPSGAVQPVLQQQQNPQIVYMLQQSKSPTLGSLSSEELQMAAEMGQLAMYLTNVLKNLPAGAILPVSQVAGLANQEKQGMVPTAGTSAGIPTDRGAGQV
ncbi:hypothetical protein CesoFtcFv8_009073 [Champsocephalus esox]|uniref:Ameloblastin n=1 Tax=Champsocephalus esox TaxID=159716 RepID=A0AAN8CCR3_9TELE|nr:hypothetical protein CesoFtcFv8_009073 [Champsocephalus esox]